MPLCVVIDGNVGFVIMEKMVLGILSFEKFG